MRKYGAIFFLFWAGACAGPKPAAAPAAKADSNFTLTVYEVVENPEDESDAYAKVFVDGIEAGKTPSGPKSSEKKWESVLPAGNRLMRFEYWTLSETGEWTRAPEEFQPREKFFRVEEGLKTQVILKFFDKGRDNAVTSSRGPRTQAP